MYKNLGLSSEEVRQIGQWKNVQAFSAHYLRLGAAGVAGRVLEQVVHKTSLVQSAEPELSRPPGRKADPGGRDNGGEAQSTNEVLLLLPASVHDGFVAGCFLTAWPLSKLAVSTCRSCWGGAGLASVV